MTQRIALLGVMALAMLAACSKQAPPQPSAGEPAAAPPPVEQAPPPDKPVEYDRAKFVSGLLGLVDTAPQCEQFRAQLEAAGNAASGPLMQSEVDKLNKIAAESMQAGCYHKK